MNVLSHSMSKHREVSIEGHGSLTHDDHAVVVCNAALVLAAVRDFRPAGASPEGSLLIEEVLNDEACHELLRRGIASMHERSVDEPFNGRGRADGLRHRFR